MKTIFTTENDKVIFTGESLKCFIPKRYENRSLVIMKNPIKVFGIFEMAIIKKPNDKPIYKRLDIPSLLITNPYNVSSTIRRGVDCYMFEYLKNQTFIESTKLIKQPNLAYLAFREFIELGNIPTFLSYNDRAMLFDNISKFTGTKLKINHAILELIIAQLSRDSNNTSIKYRHTDMKNPSTFIPLKSVTEGPDSTMAKLYGSYFMDGLNSALVSPNQDQSDLENLLRS